LAPSRATPIASGTMRIVSTGWWPVGGLPIRFMEAEYIMYYTISNGYLPQAIPV
jgi:hypothetical protein